MSRKDRIKAVRSVIEGAILIAVIIIIIRALFPSNGYMPVKAREMNQTGDGFIALSYFGVDLYGNQQLTSTGRLDEELRALKESGYVTITQQDVLNYYESGTRLPSKSLLLVFEDGRRDTGIFAQKILEKYGYNATILSYARNLESNDPKFLTPGDLRGFQKSSCWEFGSNGYRLSYINASDRYGNYLGQLDTHEFSMVSPYLDRRYDHYLMDYIRDQCGVPMETPSEMKDRIAFDYKESREIYLKALGKLPGMYILMHSNTGQFGTNDTVSTENEKWIKSLYLMNFNREGDCLNVKDSSIYDLTRMEPQPYWYPNHLLMRIWDDTKKAPDFVSGDLRKKSYWDTLSGESEFEKDTVILTSPPKGSCLIRLVNSEAFRDLSLSAELKGNRKGSQEIYLRADKGTDSYVSCQIKDNVFLINEKEKGRDRKCLFSLDLNVLDGVVPQSIDKNRLESEIKELEMSLKYAKDSKTAGEWSLQLDEKRKIKAPAVSEGAEKYVPKLELSEPGDRSIDITLTSNSMTVSINKKMVVRNLRVDVAQAGSVDLEAAYSADTYSQRNLSDDVYDGVFKNLVIRDDASGEKNGTVLYDNRLSYKDKILDTGVASWNRVINWFAKNL